MVWMKSPTSMPMGASATRAFPGTGAISLKRLVKREHVHWRHADKSRIATLDRVRDAPLTNTAAVLVWPDRWSPCLRLHCNAPSPRPFFWSLSHVSPFALVSSRRSCQEMIAKGTEPELDAAVVPTHCALIGSCTRKSLAAVRQEITRRQILVVCLCYLIMCSARKVKADEKKSATNLIPRSRKEEHNDHNGTAVEHALASASIS